ncbi:MAG: hypothetical protein Q8S21_04135 [Candidatus Paracaedibacteraceae bacterium]|nr:hypothetical protein [Candidatus Paracaedibacteraceae bacterium]
MKIFFKCAYLTLMMCHLALSQNAFTDQHQEAFNKTQQELLNSTNDLMKSVSIENAFTVESFVKLQEILAKKRNRIAVEGIDPKLAGHEKVNKLKEAKQFGNSRMLDGPVAVTPLTLLMDKYLCDTLNEKFNNFISNPVDPEMKSDETIIINHGSDLRFFEHLTDFTTNPKNIKCKEIPYSDDSKLMITQYLCDSYMHDLIYQLALANKLAQMKWVTNIEINGRSIPASSICALIKMEHDKKEKSLLPIPGFVIHHTAKEYINLLMKEAGTSWVCAMTDMEDRFLHHISRMYWFYNHAMPYTRGSEAIAKWNAQLAAIYHKKMIEFPPDYLFRLPFIMSLDEFTNDFTQRVKLVEKY